MAIVEASRSVPVLVAEDSVIYGVIFSRSNNVFVSWTAHFLADVVCLAFLLVLVK